MNATATATANAATAELTDASRAVVLAYMRTLTSGDLGALRPFFAPDVTWKMVGELPISGTWTGADEHPSCCRSLAAPGWWEANVSKPIR